MIKNYIKTAFRNLSRNKLYTVVNVLGLSLGIACSVVLLMLAQYSNTFDDFQVNKDRIYRLVNSSDGAGGERDYTPGVPGPLPDAIKEDFSEFEKVVFVRNVYGTKLFTINPDSDKPNYFELRDERLAFTQQGYLDVFTVDWKQGDIASALEGPNRIVLSEAVAKKFFPDGDALGETIIYNKNSQLKITGIIADPSPHSDMPFEIFISYATIEKQVLERGWGSVDSDDQCYILLAENDNPDRYRARLDEFVIKNFGEDNGDERYDLQPMSDLHFNDNYSNYIYSTTNKNEILVMVFIAIFLLLTACINFVNLSTAVAVRRSREVGVRKVLGGTRMQLVLQFLAESLAVVLMAVMIGLGLSELMILYVNPFMQVALDIPWGEPLFIVQVLAGSLLITLLAGFYPALVLSNFKPALALKNLITTKHSGAFSLRQGLVVFQFFISQVFIVGTIVIISQMNLLNSVDLGFTTEALVNIRIPERDPDKKKVLKAELERLANIEQASLVYTNPSSSSVSVSDFHIADNAEDYYSSIKYGDDDYLDIYKINLLSGRNVHPSDTLNEVLITKNLLEYIGYKGKEEEVLGTMIKVHGIHVPIVGVIDDFNSQSLHDKVTPVIFMSSINSYRQLTVKVNLSSFSSTNEQVKAIWQKLYPEFDYNYKFVDDYIAGFYEEEQKMAKIFSFFSGVAIFIGCLGLFALASFMINQKVKEIGVRKVLGASVANIVGIFSWSFFKLIAISFLLSAPVAWYVMDSWLENFNYRVEIGPLFFIGAFLVTLFIAVITVGYKSFKAAVVNPVNSLKDE
ncbi:ABC transporter permease [Fulvivirga sediminis]|uniref:ABC transporter permease n=1 Tax=Fulvivirga sediminis TaxID=2803949 RepID=A0A937FD19_9BACT|nr:ABC transporter permease [Fulvivirga sediminis]MBL3658303.1 ABC transporter permease [Fulvivirga sediminis]